MYGNGPVPMATLRKLRTLKELDAAWEDKSASEDWAKWAEDHPDGEAMIQWSIVLAEKTIRPDEES